MNNKMILALKLSFAQKNYPYFNFFLLVRTPELRNLQIYENYQL